MSTTVLVLAHVLTMCIIWQGYRQGVYLMDKIRTIITQLDDAAKVKSLL